MLIKKDIKSYLQFSSSKILNILKLSSHIYILSSVVIYPSSNCNYNCIMCKHARSNIKNNEKMDFSLMTKTIEDCSKLSFKPRVHFSGYGEPFVYPEFKKVMQLCKKKKIKWSATTNGYHTEKYAKDIVLNNCRSINISIHGDKSDNSRITGVKDSFEKTITGIKKLDEAKRKYKKRYPLIAINCVINNGNVINLKKILNIFIKLPIDNITFQHLNFSECNLDKKEDFLITDKNKLNILIEFVNFIENKRFPLKINFYPKIKKKDIIRYYTNKDHNFNESCIVPWLTTRIYPNGDVKLCEQFFGNIKTDPLKSIINSKQAIKFRRMIRKGTFKTPNCFRCCHRHYY